MALIPLPADLDIVRSDWSIRHPGQVFLQSKFGTGSQVLGRGPGFFAGQFEVAETDEDTDAQRRRVESFIVRLRGSENTFEVPLLRPSGGALAAGTALTASAGGLVAGQMRFTVSEQTGLIEGDMVRVGGRIYSVVAHMGGVLAVEPPGAVAMAYPTPVIWENVTALARLITPDGLNSPLNLDFGGPWVFDWVESI